MGQPREEFRAKHRTWQPSESFKGIPSCLKFPRSHRSGKVGGQHAGVNVDVRARRERLSVPIILLGFANSSSNHNRNCAEWMFLGGQVYANFRMLGKTCSNRCKRPRANSIEAMLSLSLSLSLFPSKALIWRQGLARAPASGVPGATLLVAATDPPGGARKQPLTATATTKIGPSGFSPANASAAQKRTLSITI
ncbi:hypothetical protein IF1G_06636 [Cordyceps javanica]|uniref:Uncharacterized protein n=1 Tax=Cordyceps javanica TaxID=43265 RepID=A0A545UYR1_9HYPO|nr:hypothetical protein IF1G_06636 [Cordyceps javanica]